MASRSVYLRLINSLKPSVLKQRLTFLSLQANPFLYLNVRINWWTIRTP